jgi:hypothetical protein
MLMFSRDGKEREDIFSLLSLYDEEGFDAI